MELNDVFREELLATAQTLRSFALSLCRTTDRADDLVQDTLLRALTHMHLFQPGTNLAAWLTTIMRNQFREQYRKRRREVEDPSGYYADRLKSEPEQLAVIEFAELRTALAKLPSSQRRALMLVGASDLSYEEAGARCRCAAGTVKSRVHRARARLIDLLGIEGAEDFGTDKVTRAVLAAERPN